MAIGKARALPLTSDAKRFPLIETDADIATGAEFLVAREPCFAKVVEVHGLPSARRVENSLASLLKIVTEQLISLKAADAIWRRIETRLHPFEPGEILKFSVEDLQSLGLTRAKARSFQAIATAIHSGELNFDSLHQVPDQDVLAKLLALPGIGPWTADIYLLTALGSGRCLPLRRFGACKWRRRICSPWMAGPAPRRFSKGPRTGSRGARSRHGCCGAITGG